MHPLLETLERRHPVLEGDDLAVEHGIQGHGLLVKPEQLGVGHGHVLVVAGDEPGLLVAESDGPDPVPFRLEAPFLVVELLAGEGGQHRLGRGSLFAWRLQVLRHECQPLILSVLRPGVDQMPDTG